ncbi:hypothetical protein Tco_1243391 [Tanacetum coccineum]
MIHEPGDRDSEVPVAKTFHEQTDDELTKKEVKKMEVDDQAIHIILICLPKEIYAAVDSCETAQESWFTSTNGESIESYYHHFSKLMNDFKRNKHSPEKIASNLKFLNNLQPEWRRHVTIVHKTKNSYEVDYTQLYDFLKYNQEKVNELRAERLARAHDPLALMANFNNPYNYTVFHQDQPSPIAQPGMNLGQDRQMQMVRGNGGNQFRYSRNGNVVAARAEGMLLIAQKEEAGIQLQAKEFDFMAAVGDLDEIEEVNANCILMANLQQASTSGTHIDKAPIHDSDGSAKYTDLHEPIPEPHQVQQNDSDVISAVSSRGTVEQNPATVEETRALYDSLYNNLAI